ncbi:MULTISPECIES: DUF4177 domain-containing protein [Salinibaculum]|uniref:DUF4177 domain-containing protein n=1 Tax=Salinibaculum TaxID=2732368 RepID=UPI0030CB3B1D
MGLFTTDDSDDEPTFSDRWEATTDDGIQQWEYAVLDIRKGPEDGIRSMLKDGIGKGDGPSAEELNQFGKDGWELIATIEGAADDVGMTGTEGSKTNLLLFKRPVEYERKQIPEEQSKE